MKLKDVVNYYIGQKFRCKSGERIQWSAWMKLVYGALAELERDCPDMQLLLRRLEDMTEDEATKILRLTIPSVTYGSKDEQGIYYSGPGISSAHLSFTFGNPLSFHYLLSSGFDLFGLIASGQAVDVRSINDPATDQEDEKIEAVMGRREDDKINKSRDYA